MEFLNKTPQVYIVGCIKKAVDFDAKRMYLKYEFKVGNEWKKLSGLSSGESFECVSEEEGDIPIEQPFDLNYTCKSIKGWPKLLVEAWEVDQHGRNRIAGYGVINIPFHQGTYKLEAACWRPEASYTDKIIGAYPELEFRDILLASQSRVGMPADSTGRIVVQASVVITGFELHGVSL